MSRMVIMGGGIVTLAESKAVCPHCERKIPFEELEKKLERQDKYHVRIKCLCKKFIGITVNMIGDFVAYELSNKKL